MAQPGILNLQIYQGDHFRKPITLSVNTGTTEEPQIVPVDLTGLVLKAQIRSKARPTAPLYAEFEFEPINLEQGSFALVLPPERSAEVTKNGFWDLETSKPDGSDVRTWVRGEVALTNQVTITESPSEPGEEPDGLNPFVSALANRFWIHGDDGGQARVGTMTASTWDYDGKSWLIKPSGLKEFEGEVEYVSADPVTIAVSAQHDGSGRMSLLFGLIDSQDYEHGQTMLQGMATVLSPNLVVRADAWDNNWDDGEEVIADDDDMAFPPTIHTIAMTVYGDHTMAIHVDGVKKVARQSQIWGSGPVVGAFPVVILRPDESNAPSSIRQALICDALDDTQHALLHQAFMEDV